MSRKEYHVALYPGDGPQGVTGITVTQKAKGMDQISRGLTEKSFGTVFSNILGEFGKNPAVPTNSRGIQKLKVAVGNIDYGAKY
ncbi:hypothetical protein WA026_019911 [Henosepilachna vigintioctopunctata]|uniref:Uncharacterized protein n=1 Tax=Henosepilachna vigintioctopunctata TaxID=420089 RepID=A0AAW1UU60_9CUCU